MADTEPYLQRTIPIKRRSSDSRVVEPNVHFYTVPQVPRHRAFIPSLLIHSAVVVLSGVVWVSSPVVSLRSRSVATAIVAPVRETQVKSHKPHPSRSAPALAAITLPQRVFKSPAIAIPALTPIAPAPRPAPAVVEAPELRLPVPAPPAVRAEVFAGIATGPPAISKAALPVDTGKFQGVASADRAVQPNVIARTGVFDAAEPHTAAPVTAAPVSSAGFGEVHTAKTATPQRREVAGGAGFGARNVVSTRAEGKLGVRAGAFESVSSLTAGPRRRVEAIRPADVEILYKPRPVYSVEARKLKIEGEVLVEVIFLASGQVRVGRVIKGLGHGLDEAAILAAANIRFKPAERNGRSVDSAAVARITFSLAF